MTDSNPDPLAVCEPALDPDLPIIDAHHHLWIEPPFPEMAPYPIEQFAAEIGASGHNVRQTVFVDCQRGYLTDGPEHLRVIGETRTMEAEASRAEAAGGDLAGLAAAIVGRADMRMGDAVEEVLLAHRAESPGRFKGIRHMAPWHEGMDFFNLPITEHMMCEEDFRQGVACLTRLGLVFDAWVIFTQLDDVVDLARAVPEASIVLNHIGTPVGVGPYAGKQRGEVFDTWRAGMARIAEMPNVTVKIGGMLMTLQGLIPDDVDGPMTSEQAERALRDHVLTTIELFGPDRCMFESNFPPDRSHISYGNLWNGFKRITAGFSADERVAMFHDTAKRVYAM